jgi:prepilin-type N-terminal cleavage/methylation domain-containing protein
MNPAVSSFILHPSSFSARGFTLAESLVASVVLAIAVVAVSGAIIASQKQSVMQEEDGSASMLARQLMEEVLSTPIVLSDGTSGQAGWPTVTDRSLYDTISDFNGYRDKVSTSTSHQMSTSGLTVASTGAKAPATVIAPAAATPQLLPQEYKRSVAVSLPTTLFGAAVTAGDLAIVTVTVEGGANGTKVQLTRLVSKVTYTR